MDRSPLSLLVVFVALAGRAEAQFQDGDLYVADYNDNIYRVEPGSWNVTLFAGSASGISGVSALDFADSNTLLCSNYVTNEVISFDSAATPTVLYDVTDGIYDPFGANGMAHDANGDLYVSLYYSRSILRFPAGGGAPSVFADSSVGVSRPDGLAFAANGDLYVANREANDILRIRPSGKARVFDSLTADPYTIVIRENGDIYVACYPTEEVYRYPGGDVSQRVLFETFTTNSMNPCLAFNQDQSKLYFSSTGTGNLIEIDPDSGSYTEVLPAGTLGQACSITPSGAHRSASWSNYGSGFPGTLGIPAFTSSALPVLGTKITLTLDNSYGSPTSGLLFVGYQQTSIPSGWGGDLLVLPAFVVPVSFWYGANSYDWTVPNDPTLLYFALELQAVEADPGAAKGVSFTPGLELILGY